MSDALFGYSKLSSKARHSKTSEKAKDVQGWGCCVYRWNSSFLWTELYQEVFKTKKKEKKSKTLRYIRQIAQFLKTAESSNKITEILLKSTVSSSQYIAVHFLWLERINKMLLEDEKLILFLIFMSKLFMHIDRKALDEKLLPLG